MKNKKLIIIIVCSVIALIVCGVIALILLTILAINPAKNFANARDAERLSDINAIMNAVFQYETEKDASQLDLPACDVAGADASLPIGTEQGTVNLKATLVPDFLSVIPMDPYRGTPGNSGYYICRQTDGRIRISAPFAESGKEIKVVR